MGHRQSPLTRDRLGRGTDIGRKRDVTSREQAEYIIYMSKTISQLAY